MAVLKEWKCARHGSFEGSHPICPALGCDSAKVEREFRTAPGVRSDSTRRFDAGIRKSADDYGISNFRSARAGESSFAGRAPIGQKVLWGDEIQKEMGIGLAQQVQAAQKPIDVTRPDGQRVFWPHNNGMREAATVQTQHGVAASGLTARPLPAPKEVVIARGDQASIAVKQQQASAS